MKKVLSILLAVMCLFTLVACKTNEVATTEEPPVVEETNEEVKEEALKAEVVSDVTVPEFSIEVCGEKITQEEMKDYPLYKFDTKTVNSEGTEKEYTYVGYSIIDVLKAAGLEVKEGDVVATATDGYEITYTDNIILETTLIAVLRNDEPFKEGPYLAPCASTTNGDYLKNLAIINIAVQ